MVTFPPIGIAVATVNPILTEAVLTVKGTLSAVAVNEIVCNAEITPPIALVAGPEANARSTEV